MSLQSSEKSIVISNMMHNSKRNKAISFFISLSLHATLLALFVLLTQNDAPKPTPTQHKQSSTLIQLCSLEKPLLQEAKPQQLKKRETPKKTVVKKSPAKAKALLKKQTPKVEPLEQKIATKSVQSPLPAKAYKETPTVASKQITAIETHTHAPQKSQTPQESQKATQEEISLETLHAIRSLIQENLRYPPMAKRLRIEGVVVVAFVLQEDGQVLEANILSSSANKSLDDKALQTVLSLSKEYPRLRKTIDLRIPISFSLKNS